MRYWMDTEFIDDGKTIDLISIGIACEDGRELYLESADFDRGKASQWVRENVLTHLRGGECRWTLRSIRVTLRDFFDVEEYGKPELWGWCAGYDFVAFCQIFGTMMDVPDGYPHYIHDLQQELDRIGLEDSDLPPQKGTAHNALEDARYIKKLWKWLEPEPLPHISDSEREQWHHVLTRRDMILQRDFE